MSLELIIGTIWLLGPILILIAVVAICEWYDRRRCRLDEERLVLFIALEQCYDLPPAERRRSW